MRQAQVFPAGPTARQEISRGAYRYFVGGAGLMVIGAIMLAVTLATSQSGSIFRAVSVALLCVGGVGLFMAINTLLQVRQRYQVEVTPERLIWREGPRIATLEYDEVERVDLVRGQRRHESGGVVEYPVVRFIEDDGEMMEFEVSFEDRGMVHHARFDARAIAEAVLPYIRSHAVVASAIDELLRTGEVDIDALPER